MRPSAIPVSIGILNLALGINGFAAPPAPMRVPPQMDQVERAFASHDYPRARNLLNEMSRTDPKNSAVWFNLGNVEFLTEHYGTAFKHYAETIRQGGDLAPVAQIYQAKVYRKSGRPDFALNHLSRLHPDRFPPQVKDLYQNERQTDLNANTEWALAEYNAGRFATAASGFEMQEKFVHDPGVEMLLGYSRLQTGQRALARQAFLQVKSNPQAGAYAPEAKKMLRLMDLGEISRASNGGTELRGEFLAGHNSNVYSITGDTDADAGPVVAKPETLLTLELVWVPGFARAHHLNFDFLGQWNEELSLPDQRIVTGQAAVEWVAIPKSKWELALSARLRDETLGSRSYLFKPGVGLRLGASIGENKVLSWSTEYTHVSSQRTDYDFLKSNNLSSILAYRYQGLENFFELYAGYLREASRDIVYPGLLFPLAFSGPTFGGRIGANLTDRWSWSFSSSASWRYYGATELPDDIRREDQVIDFLLRSEIQLSAALKGVTQVSYLINRSSLGPGTLNDKNYHVLKAALGLSWSLGL